MDPRISEGFIMKTIHFVGSEPEPEIVGDIDHDEFSNDAQVGHGRL